MKISESLEKWIKVFLLIIGGVVLFYFLKYIGALSLISKLLITLTPIYIAIIISWLMQPVAKHISNKFKMKYPVACVISIFILFVIISLLLLLIFPQIYLELKQFFISLPDALNNLHQELLTSGVINNNSVIAQEFNQILTNHNLTFNDLGNQVMSLLQTHTQVVSDKLDTIIKFLFDGVTIIMQICLGFIVSCYLMPNLNHFVTLFTAKIPKPHYQHIINIIHTTSYKLRSYIKAMVLDMLSVSVMLVIFNMLIFHRRVSLTSIIAGSLVAGISNCIAYLGPVVGSIPIVLNIFQHCGLLGMAIAIFIVWVVQMIESHIIYPLILGNSLNIKPITILFALLVSSCLFGIIGLFISMPLLIIIKTILVEYNIIDVNDI